MEHILYGQSFKAADDAGTLILTSGQVLALMACALRDQAQIKKAKQQAKRYAQVSAHFRNKLSQEIERRLKAEKRLALVVDVLKSIPALDKTPKYEYPGVGCPMEVVVNAKGQTPPTSGTRWATPREIVNNFIANNIDTWESLGRNLPEEKTNV